DIDGAVGADEKDAASLAGVNDLDAIGIDVPDAFVGLGVLGRDDLNRAGFIHAEPPLGNVEMVRAPVGHHAPGVFAVVAPVREVAMDATGTEDGIVRPLGRRPEPAVPIEAFFQLFLGQVARFAGRTDVDVYFLDLADAAAADVFASLAELAAG